jgi:hypothetical protein
MTRASKGLGGWSALSPQGNGNTGAASGERSGPAVDSARRPAMIASSYEEPRAGKGQYAEDGRIFTTTRRLVIKRYEARIDCGAGEIDTTSTADSMAAATSAESSSAR